MIVLREVLAEFREGRGRWWRPNGHGYTDDLGLAGLYPSNPKYQQLTGCRWVEVPAREEIEAEIDRLTSLRGVLDEVEQAEVSP